MKKNEETKLTPKQKLAFEKVRRDILVARGEASQMNDLASGLYVYEAQYEGYSAQELKKINRLLPAVQKKMRECSTMINEILQLT